MLKTGDRSRRRQLEIGVAQSAKSARGGLFREGGATAAALLRGSQRGRAGYRSAADKRRPDVAIPSTAMGSGQGNDHRPSTSGVRSFQRSKGVVLPLLRPVRPTGGPGVTFPGPVGSDRARRRFSHRNPTDNVA
jgi:hypothetical protein